MSEKFRLLMNSVDADLLEEAAAPVARRRLRPWIGAAIAACLLLAVGLPLFRGFSPTVTDSQLLAMGYEMKLPEGAKKVRYALLDQDEQEGAQASFVIRDTKYVYRTVKTEQEQPLADSADKQAQILAWNLGGVDIQLVSSSSSTSVSWYLQEDQTQCYLSANATAREVLTTAMQILRTTGLDVNVAPENAEHVTYNVFRKEGLTVAETTFQIDGITYSYRMAATIDLLEDIIDISGMPDTLSKVTAGEVLWCRAKITFDEGGQGRIVWFDVVPGILYSLSMESGASAEALQDMANLLFEPAQENS